VSDPESILAIDAGNTRVKWGVHDGRGWIATGAVLTADSATMAQVLARTPSISRAIASNVAGLAVQAELERACATHGMGLRTIRPEREQLGVTNGYRDHHQLGSDRWAALIAAHRAAAGHKLVVNVGTALTIDALTAQGEFLGGLIVPGPALMRRSLDHGTAGLRQTQGAFREFPASTPDAITTGSIQACVGAVDRVRGAMAARDAAPARALLSGGAAQEIAPHLPLPFTMHENLVLDGLVLIARNP
jgi:type III pantothenate kinase